MLTYSSFPGAPSVWYRYVDDVFAIVKGHLVEDLLNHLNSISFTVKLEWDGRLPFMDVLLQRRKDGSINTGVFRKPTRTERYLQFDSHHPLNAKKAVFAAPGQRFSYISLEENREKELEHIKPVLMENGYPRTSVEAWSRQLERNGGAKEQDEMISTVCLPYV